MWADVVVDVAPAFGVLVEVIEGVASHTREQLALEGAVEAFDLALSLRVVWTAVDGVDGEADEVAVKETQRSRSLLLAGKGIVAEHLVGKLEFLSMEPSDLVELLAAKGAQHVYVDGGITIQRFLRAGLVDELILSRTPVLLGSGIPLFGDLDADIQLEHVETESFPSGLVQSKYRRYIR